MNQEKKVLNVIGDSINSVADGIFQTRTYSIAQKLFSQMEISAIEKIRLKFNELKKSETYSAYKVNCIDFFRCLETDAPYLPMAERFLHLKYLNGFFMQDDGRLITLSYKVFEVLLEKDSPISN